MEPWVAGATPPDQRLIGWVPKIPQGFPAAGSISPGDAGNLVFDYVRKLRDANVDPMSIFPGGFPDITGLPPSYAMHGNVWDGAYDYATIYLLAYFANGPLPEDQMGEFGTAPGWPNEGDNLEQRVYGWAAKTVGWDGMVRHYELRKVMQVQKWSSPQTKWVVYNQYGHDLTYNQDPITLTWSAGADVGTWLNAHGAEIFSVFNAVFTAMAAMTGYGAVIGALQQAMKALAITAATGDWNQIIKAIGSVASVMAGLPGVAEFGDQLLKAGGAVISDVFVGAVSKDVMTAVLSAEGEVETVVAKTKELMQTAEKTLAVLKQAGVPPAAWPPGVLRTVGSVEADIRAVRENLTPDHLKPWFDKAVAQGRAALVSNLYKPGQLVPYYAKGTWDQAIALGTMVNEAAKPPPPLDINQLTLAEKRALFFNNDLKAAQISPANLSNAAEFIRQADLLWSGTAGYSVRGFAKLYGLDTKR